MRSRDLFGISLKNQACGGYGRGRKEMGKREGERKRGEGGMRILAIAVYIMIR